MRGQSAIEIGAGARPSPSPGAGARVEGESYDDARPELRRGMLETARTRILPSVSAFSLVAFDLPPDLPTSLRVVDCELSIDKNVYT